VRGVSESNIFKPSGLHSVHEGMACNNGNLPLAPCTRELLGLEENTDPSPTSFSTCRCTNCPKNHLRHTTNTSSNEDQAVIHLEHHKNSGRQGPVEYVVAPGMVKVWAMIEGAAAYLGPNARGLFFPPTGYKTKGQELYSEDYMSSRVSKQLSKCGRKCGANDARHLFGTMFSLYLGQATFTTEDLSSAYLRDAAAVMTGSSSVAWNRTYDANARVRGYRRVLHHYPSFKEFVVADFERVQATVGRNPITRELQT